MRSRIKGAKFNLPYEYGEIEKVVRKCHCGAIWDRRKEICDAGHRQLRLFEGPIIKRKKVSK